jgi:glyoxylase-like metal-dependent hydrolase (beta-lactamase superfamily II)
MSVEFTIISIGTLSANRLWGEQIPVRTAHATTTLIRSGEKTILVDPGLPSVILAAKLNERTGLHLSDVTDVFCTTLREPHRRGLDGLTHATWWCSEKELTSYTHGLEDKHGAAGRLASDEADAHAKELALLDRFRPADDDLAPQVSLYPLEGPSPGGCGLLLTPPTQTILIAGDAAVTAEHLRAGQVWDGCEDTQAAMDSLTDLLEVADIVVCGHDNLTIPLAGFSTGGIM